VCQKRDVADERERTISNERVKLLAQALDRASTAFLALGFVTPFALSGNAGLVAFAWLAGAGVLHVAAHLALGRLR
jgi:hypothetical protein